MKKKKQRANAREVAKQKLQELKDRKGFKPSADVVSKIFDRHADNINKTHKAMHYSYPGEDEFEKASNNLDKIYKKADKTYDWVDKNLPRYSKSERKKIRNSIDKTMRASDEDRIDY